jgi:hypothetical protein
MIAALIAATAAKPGLGSRAALFGADLECFIRRSKLLAK